MFHALSEKFHSLFSKLFKEKTLTEENVQAAVEEVRLALLEADVQYSVAKTFIKRVKEKALGQEVIKQVKPADQFAKIVHDELVALMGEDERTLRLKKRPASIMLCGLQGSGKTTQAVKLANYLRKQGSFANPCVVACDLQRPAAIEQLKTLAASADISCFTVPGEKNPLQVAKAAIETQEKQVHGLQKWDLLIFDTAGRLHVDDVLMQELKALVSYVKPEELLFVANAALGQDAVKSCAQFHECVPITGTVLTMLDGTSRAGAAISIREVTGQPLMFEGVGERIEDIRPFNPISMADRILGMGDAINLVRKASEHIKEEDAKDLEKKIRSATFTYEDYLKQMQMMKKMGSFKSLLGMLPGMSQMKDLPIDDSEIYRVEAIILSMNPAERQEKVELSIGRKKRIAKGSGTTLDDVHRLAKSFKHTKQFFKNVPNNKILKKMIGGSIWQ